MWRAEPGRREGQAAASTPTALKPRADLVIDPEQPIGGQPNVDSARYAHWRSPSQHTAEKRLLKDDGFDKPMVNLTSRPERLPLQISSSRWEHVSRDLSLSSIPH